MAFPLKQPRLIQLQQWMQDLDAYDAAPPPQGQPPERGRLIGAGEITQGVASVQLANEFVAWVQSGDLNLAAFRATLDRHGLGHDLNEPDVGLTGIPQQPLSEIWDRFCGRVLMTARPECTLPWRTPGILLWALNTTTLYTPVNDGPNDISLAKQQQWVADNIVAHPEMREAVMLWELSGRRSSLELDPFENWSPKHGVSPELWIAVLGALDREHTREDQHGLHWIEKHQSAWLADVRQAHSLYCQLQGELVYDYEWEYGIDAEALANAQSRASQVEFMVAQRHAPLSPTPEMGLDQLFSFN